MKGVCRDVERVRAQIAKNRDKLRDLIAEAEDMAEQADSAEMDLGTALSLIEGAADRISETQ